MSHHQQPYVKIVEQPASKALRFRYECEGRSAGSLPGVYSRPEYKSYPTIQIVGYQGRAVVVVSCVTKDPPYRPHPHSLVGREGCKRGVCSLEINSANMTATFSSLGIQCVKKKNIERALLTREEIRVDPFRTGFEHRHHLASIDLNAVRLCFQVFLEGDKPGKFAVALAPVISDPIFDKKAISDLNIYKISDCSSPVEGGNKDIIILCEKITKDDIQVRLYEEIDNQIIWESLVDILPSQMHKQHSIWFRAPRYKNLDINEPVRVALQLRRPSDGAISDSIIFEYLPTEASELSNLLRRKRRKIEDPSNVILQLKRNNNLNFGLGIKSENAGNWNIPTTSNNIITLNTKSLDSQEINELASNIGIMDHLPEINNLSLSDI